MGNTGYRGGRTNFVGCLGVRVTPFALSLRGLLGELPFITCEDNVMLESMTTIYYVYSIFSLICNDVRLRITSFKNVADNPANRARDGIFPLLS